MVKFSEDLWNGFDAINVRTETGIQVLKDVSEFLKARASLENDYAKKLAELTKKVPGSGLFSKTAPVEKESKTLKGSLLSFQEEGQKIATHHLDFATKINNDVIKPLDAFIKTKEPERKKLVMESQKRLEAWQKARKTADNAKEVYSRIMKEVDQATEAYDKTKVELANADEKKKKMATENEKRAQKKLQELEEKGKKAEAEYQKAVDASNETTKETYSTHLPPLLDGLQQIETDRYSQVQTILSELHKAQRQVPDALVERCDEISKMLEALDIEADLTEFAEANKSTISEPELMKFIPHKEPAETKEDA